MDKLRESVKKDSPYEPKYEGRLREGLRFGAAREDDREADAREQVNVALSPSAFTSRETDARVQDSSGGRRAEVSRLSDHSEGLNGSGTTFAGKDLLRTSATSGNSVSRIDGESPLHTAALSGDPPVQASLADYDSGETRLLSEEARPRHRIIGQLFATYWLVEFEERFYMIDQHAAHEKILFEQTMRNYREKEVSSQMVSPPILLSLTMQEEVLLKKYRAEFEKLGFVIEHFGGKEYSVSAVPANLYGIDGQSLISEMVDGLESISAKDTPDLVAEKIADLFCKAAVKGNHRLSRAEAEQMIDDLLKLENPYFCPHGRPVIISMTKYEIEKKFKRIV